MDKLSVVFEKMNAEDGGDKSFKNSTLFKSHHSYQKKPGDKKIYRNKPPKSEASTTVNDNENPFEKFERIKAEINFIESDLGFYKTNPSIFEEKFNYTLDSAFSEIKKLRKALDFIQNTENFNTIKELIHRFKSTSHLSNPSNPNHPLSLLNKKIYETNNLKMLSNINIIKEIKSKEITGFDDITYELYLTPDTQHIKLYSQIVEIQKRIEELQERIGNFDLSKKMPLSETVINIKHHLRLFDKDFQKEIGLKTDVLMKKLEEVTAGKSEFYKSINTDKLDRLYKMIENNNTGGSGGKNIEGVIFKTLNSIDSLRQFHEDAACIFVKISEVQETSEKMIIQLDEQLEVIEELKKTVEDNNTLIEKNFGNLKARFNLLKNK